MKTIRLSELYKTDYDCCVLSCLRQRWEDVSQFSCVGNPKKDGVLLLLQGYDASYRLRDGSIITAKDGSLVYTPSESEYCVNFTRSKNSEHVDAHTIGIRFTTFFNNERVKFNDDVTIFACNEKIHPLFIKELLLCKNPDGTFAEKKAALFEILSYLGRKADQASRASFYKNNDGIFANEGLDQSKFETIRAGYEYLNERFESNESVEDLAALCYVSPVWFRKIFKAYTGFSPAEYRKNLRLTQAERYLKYGSMSISEIAQSVGYNDVSLFIRHFKKRYNVTPLSMRKNQ